MGWSDLGSAAGAVAQLARRCFAHDSARREICLFGGNQSSYRLTDTWIFRTDRPADYVAFGQACAGSAGTPALTNAQNSLPWLGDTFTAEVREVPANAGMLMMTGFRAPSPVALTQYGMPGCEWFVSNDVGTFLFAGPAGVAQWSLTIPNVPSSIGVVLYQQAFVLDPPVNALGAVVTNASELHTGVR
jgi:hypothetical protein